MLLHSADLQVRQAQQMATLVARKKSELTAKLERLQEKRDTLAATLDSSKGASGWHQLCSRPAMQTMHQTTYAAIACDASYCFQ